MGVRACWQVLGSLTQPYSLNQVTLNENGFDEPLKSEITLKHLYKDLWTERGDVRLYYFTAGQS